MSERDAAGKPEALGAQNPLRQEPLDGKEQPWYGPGLKFTCTQCGNCCTGPSGYVWFEPEEAEAMAEFLDMSLEDFMAEHVVEVEGRPSLGEKRVGGAYDCLFLQRHPDGKKTCTIYPVRPTQCRTWPFWESNLESPVDWKQAGRTCPGMQQGGWEEEAKGNFVPIEQIRVRLEENPEGL